MRETRVEDPVKHFVILSHASDTLNPGENLYNIETLVSASGVFELGFFSSKELTNHYLGILFNKDKSKKAVWVANRDNPLIDSSGVFTIREDGNIVISDARPLPILVNIGSLATTNNTSARLLDSGNLILIQGETIVWLSSDCPSDTFLPGMALGLFDMDKIHVREKYLVSWLSPCMPSSGAFALGIDLPNKSQFNLWHRSDHQEIGFWDGHSFRFIFQSSSDRYNFSFVSNNKEIYLTNLNSNGSTAYSWFVLASTRDINGRVHNERRRDRNCAVGFFRSIRKYK